MIQSFSARIAYAKRCILGDMGAGHYGYTRAFDNCFEQYDGDYVMIRLWQEAEKDPLLASRLKGFGTDLTRAMYEDVKHLSPRAIGALAKIRREAGEEHCRNMLAKSLSTIPTLSHA